MLLALVDFTSLRFNKSDSVKMICQVKSGGSHAQSDLCHVVVKLMRISSDSFMMTLTPCTVPINLLQPSISKISSVLRSGLVQFLTQSGATRTATGPDQCPKLQDCN
jgi:hypothetical protein